MDNSELCERNFLSDDGQNGITAVYENRQAYKATDGVTGLTMTLVTV